MFLSDEQVAAYLQALTDKEFIAFFYKHLAARRLASEDANPADTHLVLAEARRVDDKSGGWKPWTVELLCNSPRESNANALVAWRGEHCGFQTGSWRRFATCPVCGDEVRDS